jgi:hypothetical protein
LLRRQIESGIEPVDDLADALLRPALDEGRARTAPPRRSERDRRHAWT